MTEQFPNDTPPADEPATEATGGRDRRRAPPSPASGSSQLESMIKGIATQAAPVAKEIGAKAAELAAVAAVKAGPAAHRAAELTTEYGAKFAERAQSVAADLRSQAPADAVDERQLEQRPRVGGGRAVVRGDDRQRPVDRSSELPSELPARSGAALASAILPPS